MEYDDLSGVDTLHHRTRDYGGWLMLAIGMGLWLIAIAYPVIWSLFTTLTSPTMGGLAGTQGTEQSVSYWDWSNVPMLLAQTAMWGFAVACGSLILGIPVGLMLGSKRNILLKRLIAWLTLLVLVLPRYLTYWTWSSIAIPGSLVHEWVRSHPERIDLLKSFEVWWGLSLWTWPIVAFSVAGVVRTIPRQHLDLLSLDGAGRLRTLWHIARFARSGIILGFGVAFLATISDYVVFDLALVRTYGDALRRVVSETGQHELALRCSIPLMLMTIIVVLCIFWASKGAESTSKWDLFGLFRYTRQPNDVTLEPPTIGKWLPLILSVGVLILSLGIPVLLMIQNINGLDSFRQLSVMDGASIVLGIWTALVAGIAITLLSLLYMRLFTNSLDGHGGFLHHCFLWVHVIGWIWVGLIPAVSAGAMLVTAYNIPILDYISHSPLMISIGYIARFGWLSVIVGYWVASHETRDIADQRQLDGATTLFTWMKAAGSGTWLSAIAAGGIAAIASLSEISMTVILTPPGYQVPAERLLNRLHYAREDAAIAMCLSLVVVTALITAIIAYIPVKPTNKDK